MNNGDAIAAALEDVLDQALVFHGFSDYMRDYDLFIEAGGPKAGPSPRRLRYRFTHCVRATVTTTVPNRAWPDSLNDCLVQPLNVMNPPRDEYAGFVWGVRWQCLHPSMRLEPQSSETREWATRTGLQFHQVSIETNAHHIALVFSDLLVDSLEPGFAPYVVSAS